MQDYQLIFEKFSLNVLQYVHEIRQASQDYDFDPFTLLKIIECSEQQNESHDKNSFIIVLKQLGTLVGIFPLRIYRGLFANGLIDLNSNGFDYNGFILHKSHSDKSSKIFDEIIQIVSSELNINIQFIYFKALERRSLNFLKGGILRPAYYNYVFHYDGCMPLNKKQKKDTIRNKNKLSKEHSMEVEHGIWLLDSSKIEQFVCWKLHNLPKMSRRTKTKLTQIYLKYFRLISICHQHYADCILLSQIKLNGTTQAFSIGFVNNTTYYYLFPVYNPDYAHFSIGKILQLEILDYCEAKKFRTFDFCNGNETYKRWFSNDVKNVYEYTRCIGYLGNLFIWRAKLQDIIFVLLRWCKVKVHEYL